MPSHFLPTGADDFTPALIYVTLRCRPESLASNLTYIERYRSATRLVSESAYFFVQMVSFDRKRLSEEERCRMLVSAVLFTDKGG